MDVTPGGKMSLGRSTPFKRMRSPTGRLSYDPMCTPTCDEYDDAALDNVRSHKRYLSEAMATDLSRLNMAFGEEPGTKASSPSISSMQTDRDSSGGCSSPTLSECFNPFDSPRVHPREQPYLTGAGSHGRVSHSPSKSGVHPSTSPVKPHLMASGSCQGSLVSPMQGTPGRRGHLSRRGAALDAGERLPPSPSDPQLGMDLRKTALLRSLLLRTEEKVRATPGAAMRRRSRMSDIMSRSAPEPFSRGGALRSLSELASPDGSADMDLGGSPSSDEDDVQGTRQGGCARMGAIFSLSDIEDLSLKERASLILGEASREARRQLDDALDPDSVLQPVSFEKTIRQRT
ncbi:hypothetical protein WJX75_009153 [Coccomyxa subellipsoidea]|uniref:Uncharacterized protein n=1 Tax=Coccomyxa subellipsoidea TaxID=248742 RepID=A0ABR2YZ73_9CHLO